MEWLALGEGVRLPPCSEGVAAVEEEGVVEEEREGLALALAQREAEAVTHWLALPLAQREAETVPQEECEGEGVRDCVTLAEGQALALREAEAQALGVTAPEGACGERVALEQGLAEVLPVVERLMLWEGLTERVRVVVRV